MCEQHCDPADSGGLHEGSPCRGIGVRHGVKYAGLQQLVDAQQTRGFIRNADVRQALGVSRTHARELLATWIAGQWPTREGERKATKYLPAPMLTL